MKWMSKYLVPLAVGVALATAPACSTIELPGRDGGIPSSIVITPGTLTGTLSNDKVIQQRFRAYGIFPNGKIDLGASDAKTPQDAAAGPPGSVDITDKVTWTVEDTSLGRFDSKEPNLFRTEVEENGKVVAARHGGTTRIYADLAGTRGIANLTFKYQKDWFVEGAKSSDMGKFSGKKAGAISIRYPLNGVLMPPNIGQMDVHYNRGAGTNDRFRITFTSSTSRVRIVTTKLTHTLGLHQWQGVGLSNKDNNVSLTVEGMKSTDTSKKWVSATFSLGITDSELRGGLYYWVVTKPEGIYRYNFEKPKAAADAYYTRKEAGDCVGCHAISRGGDYMAHTRTAGNGDADILDVKRLASLRKPGYEVYKADFHTFSPDGKEVIVVHGGVLKRRDIFTGKALETIPTGTGKATHPDWSPDGTMLAYVRVADADYHWSDSGPPVMDDTRFRRGSIYVITRNAAGKWGTPKLLVKSTSGYNFYYPTFSSKGDWILYNRSSGDSYSDASATIYCIKPTGEKSRVLGKIYGTNLSNSWPRWSPFVQHYKGRTIYWLTFSSVRNFGDKLLNSKITTFNNKVPQIWMTAFDVANAEARKDPSYPPFWLPFQDIAHHNHIAQWTEKLMVLQ